MPLLNRLSTVQLTFSAAEPPFSPLEPPKFPEEPLYYAQEPLYFAQEPPYEGRGICPARMTEDTRLDYTSLAQKIKTGELTLSSVKSEYIAITALTTTSRMGYGPI